MKMNNRWGFQGEESAPPPDFNDETLSPPLYLGSTLMNNAVITHPDVADRSPSGRLRPCVSAGRHIPQRRARTVARAIQARITQGRATQGVTMPQSDEVIGIDVSKAQLDLAMRPGGEHWNSPNDEPGIRAPWLVWPSCGQG